MGVAPLTADGGELIVLYRLATYTWGSYSVTWPEGFEPPELAPDRQLGFVAKLPGPEPEPFGRRFVRADAQIDVPAGFSTMEQILDDAESRTAGEMLFERDITSAGLGRMVPKVHFDIGDLVPVRLWGRILPDQLVTAIDQSTEPGRVRDYRVHTGGQLLSDTASRERSIDMLERDIDQERRERREQVGAVRQTANTAQDTANAALAAVEDADDLFQQKLQEARDLIDEGRASAALVEGHVQEAGRLATSAEGYKQAALEAAELSDQILSAVGADAEAAEAALAAIQLLHQQVMDNVVLAQQAVADGQQKVTEAQAEVLLAKEHADRAAQFSQDTGLLVEEAEALNEAIEGIQGQINALHSQAIQAASDAAAEAGIAAGHAGAAAGKAGEAATSALEAAATNTAAISLLTTAQGLLQTATQSNTDAIGKLEDAVAMTNVAVRAAAAASGANSAAIMQVSMATQEASKAATSALESTAALADAVEEVEKAQEAQGLAQISNAAASAAASVAAAAAQKAAESARDAQQWSWHKLVVTRAEAFKADGQMFAQFTSDNAARIAPYAGWVGDVVAKGYFANNSVQGESVKIPMVDEFINLGGGSTALKFVEIEYLRNLGIARRHEKTLSNWQLASDNTWYTVSGGTFTATVSGPYSILFDVGWDAAGYNGGYYLRVLRNGNEVVRNYQSRLGPQWPWQGDGHRKMMIDRTDPPLHFSKNDVISFQVRRDNAVDFPTQRKIRDLSVVATWLEPPS